MTREVPSLEDAIRLAKTGHPSVTKCPAHEDGMASLSVGPGEKHPVVMKCHAGCKADDIIAAANINWEALVAETTTDQAVTEVTTTESQRQVQSFGGLGKPQVEYAYADEHGEELFRVRRYALGGGKKTFRQGRYVDGHWTPGMDGVRRVLYNLPAVIAAVADSHTVVIVEGEKDADTVNALGRTATTSPMGAGKWLPEYTAVLAGADVVIISDADEPGRKHAREVRRALLDAGCTVRVFEPQPPHKDVTDHITAGLKISDLLETKGAQEPERVEYAVDFVDILAEPLEENDWIIPNVFARGERLLLTGFEGEGKSTMLRELAVKTAAGVHWWSLTDCDPKRVLMLDMENHPRQTQKSYRRLARILRDGYHRSIEPGMLSVVRAWDEDVDLLTASGEEWMLERIHAYKPDVVFMGPLTNLAGRDLREDEPVRRIRDVVKKARSLYDVAVVMEHHAPLRQNGDKERSVRPYGSSIFLRFPDFGYGLRPTEVKGYFEWQKTRGPRERDREFPEYLRWGSLEPGSLEWYWETVPAAEFEELAQEAALGRAR